MKTTTALPPLLQNRLFQAQTRYNRLRLLRHAGTFLAAASLLVFALLFSVERGWLTSLPIFLGIAVPGGFAVFIGGLILMSTTLSRRRPPALLAAALEGARPGLQDRVNTLVHLDAQPANSGARRFFARAIAEQALGPLRARASTAMFPRARALVQLTAGLACVAGVVWFARHYQPWRYLVSGSVAMGKSQPPPTDAPFELDAKNTAETAAKAAWGEVRIVEPGHDQKLTKLDVVPLRVEMAARDPLTVHEWVTSVNGQPEVVHALDPVPEPCFAAYSILFYLDELKVSDWDVVSYYARAQTDKGQTYGSQIYFIEIRPFRDDLLKGMPGGAGGKAYQMLNELSELIAQQGKLLRETHQHEQMTYDRPELQTEDRRKLSGAESDLALATDHAYGKIASAMENANVGEVLSHLDTAEGHMRRSADALRNDVVSEGKHRQEQALTELIATRKALQKVVSEHPEAFGDGSSQDADNDPTADDPKSKLKALQQVAEYRNQQKAAQDALAKLAAEEKRLSNLPTNTLQNGSKTLAAQQAEMSKQLGDLSQEHPDLFKSSQATVDGARANMQQAQTELANKESYDARTSLTRAADNLNDLNKSLNAHNTERDLQTAYAMKKAVDQAAQSLHAAETKPDALTPGQADALAQQARQSTQTLKQASGQGFGPGLSDALSGQKQADLDAALQRFQSGKGKARAQAAADARANLENVSKAFDGARPELVKDMAKQDALGGRTGPGQGQDPGQGPSGLDALLEKLQSLGLQDQNGHQLSPQARTKERAELLGQMETEIPKDLGKTDAAMALLAEARQELTKQGNLPVDGDALKHLQEQLEHMQASASEKKANAEAAAGTNVSDADRAPATYRERLRRYYETLSKLNP